MRKLAYLFLPLFICACTQHPKVEQLTKPAVIIKTKDTKKVANKIAAQCDSEGFQVDSLTDNSVSCSRTSSDMVQLFMGTNYGTEMRSNMRFTIIALEGAVKVTATAWFGNQTAMGQNRSYDATNGNGKETLQRMMINAKSQMEGK